MEQTLERLRRVSADVTDLKNKYKNYKRMLCATHGNKFENIEEGNNFWAKYKWWNWLNKQGENLKWNQ